MTHQKVIIPPDMHQQVILDEPLRQKVVLGAPVHSKVIIPYIPPPPIYDFLEPFETYGVQWNVNDATPQLTRIGNMDMHRNLPIQSLIRRCLLTDGGGEWLLHPDDSRLMPDGSPADLTGGIGQYMVSIPGFWYKTEVDGDICRLKISEKPFSGYRYFRKAFMSVAEATVHRPTNRLSSVVSLDPAYRGGNNDASRDNLPNTQLGMGATVISRTNFRNFARNRGLGWEMLTYHVYNALRILYLVEYANRNTQLPYTDELTPQGFRQGGLGVSVTDVNSARWSNFNGRYPFVPIGHTAELGNHTGVKDITIDDFSGSPYTTQVASYRGVQNFFGHLWQNADGVLFKINSNAEGGTSEVYVSDDPAAFSDNNPAGMEMIGLLPRGNGYIRDVIFGDGAHFLPSQVGAGSTTYYADYFYTSIPGSGFAWRTMLLGGGALFGALAGAFLATSRNAPSRRFANIGSRLCFLT